MIALVKELTLEELISKNVALFTEVNPNIKLDSDSDYYMPLIQSWSEAELRLRVETNFNFNQFIWMNAVGVGLDNVAQMFGISRLQGSKPYANFTFSISTPKDVDISVPSLLLGGGTANANIESFILPANSTSVSVVGVLDSYIESTSIKTEELLTTLPYLAKLTQTTNYANGATVESDEALRERIGLSFAEFSTAGPKNAYIKKTLEADSRIKDVDVRENNFGVQITIYASQYDTVLVSRVQRALNIEEQRPLTDKIALQEATKVSVIINAKIALKTNIIQADVDTLIKNKVGSTLFKIGQKLSISKIIDMLFVEGVEDVTLNSPASNVNTGLTSVIEIVALELVYV